MLFLEEQTCHMKACRHFEDQQMSFLHTLVSMVGCPLDPLLAHWTNLSALLRSCHPGHCMNRQLYAQVPAQTVFVLFFVF